MEPKLAEVLLKGWQVTLNGSPAATPEDKPTFYGVADKDGVSLQRTSHDLSDCTKQLSEAVNAAPTPVPPVTPPPG